MRSAYFQRYALQQFLVNPPAILEQQKAVAEEQRSRLVLDLLENNDPAKPLRRRLRYKGAEAEGSARRLDAQAQHEPRGSDA